MEPKRLRSAPLRPPADVDPAAAATLVGERLPTLEDPARRALALVELVGRSRPEVADALGLSAEAVGELLYRARKELRRDSLPLSATGWCERAERLLSDRLDDELMPPGPARLEAHLRHCERCVEHERRLEGARDALVRACVELLEPSAPEPPAPRAIPLDPPAPATLHVVPGEDKLAAEARAATAAGFPLVPERRPSADLPAPAAAEPPAAEPPAVKPSAAEPPVAKPPAVKPSATERPAAEPPVAAPTETSRLVALGVAQGNPAWSLLYLSGAGLAIASLVLTVLAAFGAVDRVF